MSPLGNRNELRARGILRRAALVGALLAIALLGPILWVRPGTTQVASPSGDPILDLKNRAQGCAVCLRMIETLSPAEFANDVHTFACRTCHNPHTQKAAEEWRNTCTSSGCHPRAWTRTVFHRVDAEVFVNCMNCHGVHQWRLDGRDCLGCHRSGIDSLGVLAVTRVEGVKEFDHRRHAGVECSKCHSLERRHAELRLASAADCSSCHHQARRDVACASCHSGKSMAFSKVVPTTIALSVGDGPRERNLVFPHQRHTGLECSKCHAAGGEPGRADCASCHDSHHRMSADCTQCHAAPPADAHDVSVHEAACTDCHERGLVKSAASPRNLCLTCHRTMKDHNAGEACADCHEVALPGTD